MKKYGNEFKVGITIMLAIAGLVDLTIWAGDYHLKSEGYRITVRFDDIAGLEKNAPVMLRGYEVGRVEEMKIKS